MQQQINLFDIWDLQFPFSFLLFVILFIKSFITFKCFVVKWYCFTLNEYKRISLECINIIEPDICVVISWGWMLNRKLAQWIFLKWARCCSRTMQAPAPALYTYNNPFIIFQSLLESLCCLTEAPCWILHPALCITVDIDIYHPTCLIIGLVVQFYPFYPLSFHFLLFQPFKVFTRILTTLF